jgi:short-chain fatty acids transporter
MRALTRFFVAIMQKYLPDAFLFAVILTFIAFGAAWVFTDKGFIDIVNAWGNELWGLLAFAIQVILIVVTGLVIRFSGGFATRKSLEKATWRRPHSGLCRAVNEPRSLS